jgi:hypothetical protein
VNVNEKNSDEIDKNEIDFDLRKALRVEKAGYISEMIKALIAVNSGGAVAILAFMGALVKEKAFLLEFKSFGFYAFIFFAIGIVAALFAPAALIDQVTAIRGNKKAKKWIFIAAVFFGVSIAAMVLGLITISLGVSKAF